MSEHRRDGATRQCALLGAVLLCVPGGIAIAFRVVAAYRESPERGQHAAIAVGIGIGCVLALFVAGYLAAVVTHHVRIGRVRRSTQDPAFVAREVSGFADGVVSLQGEWPRGAHLYCVTFGDDIRIWAGLREPHVVLVIRVSSVDEVKVRRIRSPYSTNWALVLLVSGVRLPLALESRFVGSVSKTGVERIAAQLRSSAGLRTA